MRNNPEKSVPDLFMASNWSKEKQMVQLFTEGLRNGVRGFDTAREYKVERQVEIAIKHGMIFVHITGKGVR